MLQSLELNYVMSHISLLSMDRKFSKSNSSSQVEARVGNTLRQWYLRLFAHLNLMVTVIDNRLNKYMIMSKTVSRKV